MHCELLYCLCNDLPVFDEICKRSLRFIAACLSHHCDLVRFFAWHGIVCAPGTSLIGRNLCDLIDNSNYYGRCLLARDELCDIITCAP